MGKQAESSILVGDKVPQQDGFEQGRSVDIPEIAEPPAHLQKLPRTEIIALCDRLGHDPHRVAAILIEPDRVTVTYHHPVTNE